MVYYASHVLVLYMEWMQGQSSEYSELQAELRDLKEENMELQELCKETEKEKSVRLCR